MKTTITMRSSMRPLVVFKCEIKFRGNRKADSLCSIYYKRKKLIIQIPFVGI